MKITPDVQYVYGSCNIFQTNSPQYFDKFHILYTFHHIMEKSEDGLYRFMFTYNEIKRPTDQSQNKRFYKFVIYNNLNNVSFDILCGVINMHYLTRQT